MVERWASLCSANPLSTILAYQADLTGPQLCAFDPNIAHGRHRRFVPALQGSDRQEVGCSHPGLDRPEAMLDRLAPLAHFFAGLTPHMASRARALKEARRARVFWRRKF
jgi:hypothetical protein